MTGLNALFDTPKPVIAMVHLAALPGSAPGGRSLAEVTDRAVEEAGILTQAGYDALLLQNVGDIPAPHAADEATVAYMTHVAGAVRRASDLPLGINVLMNGSRAALAIAAATGARFVRIKVLVGVVVTSTGMVVADPHDVLAFRQRIGAQEVAILADIYDRTSSPLGDMPIEVMADLALRHGGADGLIVTGYSVGDTQDRLRTIREILPDARLLAGGGAKAENVAALLEASDGIIVGSAFKTGGGFTDPVDPAKAADFMQRAAQARDALQGK